MSNAPDLPPRWGIVRLIAIGCVLISGIACAGWIAHVSELPRNWDSTGQILAAFIALNVLALFGLALCILRPGPRKINFMGRSVGKTLLFFLLGAATVLFLFVTCIKVV